MSAQTVRREERRKPVPDATWVLSCRRDKPHGPVTVYTEHRPMGVCPCGLTMIVERMNER